MVGSTADRHPTVLCYKICHTSMVVPSKIFLLLIFSTTLVGNLKGRPELTLHSQWPKAIKPDLCEMIRRRADGARNGRESNRGPIPIGRVHGPASAAVTPAADAGHSVCQTAAAGGASRYLDTKEAAILEVHKLREQGIRSIGAAFDPIANIAYGADFLRRLCEEVHGWSLAIGHSHSRTREHWSRYRIKVYKLWRLKRRRAAAIRREQVIAAFNERKAQHEAAQR